MKNVNYIRITAFKENEEIKYHIIGYSSAMSFSRTIVCSDLEKELLKKNIGCDIIFLSNEWDKLGYQMENYKNYIDNPRMHIDGLAMRNIAHCMAEQFILSLEDCGRIFITDSEKTGSPFDSYSIKLEEDK